jgi:hypothetical protein
VKDPVITQFWAEEFTQVWDRRYRADAIAAVQNRLGRLFAVHTLLEQMAQRFVRVRRPMPWRKLGIGDAPAARTGS